MVGNYRHRIADELYAVNGIHECIVIAPDDFTATLVESYDASAREASEASGIVCLPRPVSSVSN